MVVADEDADGLAADGGRGWRAGVEGPLSGEHSGRAQLLRPSGYLIRRGGDARRTTDAWPAAALRTTTRAAAATWMATTKLGGTTRRRGSGLSERRRQLPTWAGIDAGSGCRAQKFDGGILDDIFDTALGYDTHRY